MYCHPMRTLPSVFMLDRAALNQSVKAQFSFSIETEFSPTLMAKGPGGVLDLRTSSGGITGL